MYIMTERVRPLAPAIQERASKSAQEKEDWLLWGIHRVSVRAIDVCRTNPRNLRISTAQIALAFINEACASTHGNVRVDSVFISPSGEWKLGGFEVLSSPKDDAAILYVRSYCYVSYCTSQPIYIFRTDYGKSAPRRVDLRIARD